MDARGIELFGSRPVRLRLPRDGVNAMLDRDTLPPSRDRDARRASTSRTGVIDGPQRVQPAVSAALDAPYFTTMSLTPNIAPGSKYETVKTMKASTRSVPGYQSCV
jgi:hypothetical protein